MILVIDNYDSFTYNLVQYIGAINSNLVVHRNDMISVADIREIKPSKIIISPGPGAPESAGISIDVIKKFSGKIPIFGICLGHQAITVAFGGDVGRADKIVHGKTSKITHFGSSIFNEIPAVFEATRYHSLVSIEESFPMELKITARTKDNLIMALEHIHHPVFGVQFHPESIVTEYGKKMINNFLEVR